MRKALWLAVASVMLIAFAGLTVTFAQGSLAENDRRAGGIRGGSHQYRHARLKDRLLERR